MQQWSIRHFRQQSLLYLHSSLKDSSQFIDTERMNGFVGRLLSWPEIKAQLTPKYNLLLKHSTPPKLNQNWILYCNCKNNDDGNFHDSRRGIWIVISRSSISPLILGFSRRKCLFNHHLNFKIQFECQLTFKPPPYGWAYAIDRKSVRASRNSVTRL